MKFILEIELGNAEMRTSGQVAHALIDVASRIMNNRYPASKEIERGIMDANGNCVGNWSFRK